MNLSEPSGLFRPLRGYHNVKSSNLEAARPAAEQVAVGAPHTPGAPLSKRCYDRSKPCLAYP